MRDDSHKWTPPAGVPDPLDLGGATLRAALLPRQTLFSGTAVRQNSPLPVIGWPDVATGEAYRITLRRDRVVGVDGREHQVLIRPNLCARRLLKSASSARFFLHDEDEVV